MVKGLLAYAFLFISFTSYSQQVSGIIIDSATGEKVPFASIFIKSSPNKGCYSKEDGSFVLDCSLLDTLCISAMGYRKMCVVPKNGGSLTHYNLTNEIRILPEVIIKGKIDNESRIFTFGYHDDKNEIRFPGTLGSKILVFIKPIDKSGKFVVSNLFFSIAKTLGEVHSKGKVRILLFEALTNNKMTIGINLLPEDVLYEVANKSYKLKADISKYNIIFPPDGLYVGLEWLGEKNSKVSSNIAPRYFRSVNTDFKTLESFFDDKYYDPYLKKENLLLNKKYVPNFGLEVKEVQGLE